MRSRVLYLNNSRRYSPVRTSPPNFSLTSIVSSVPISNPFVPPSLSHSMLSTDKEGDS